MAMACSVDRARAYVLECGGFLRERIRRPVTWSFAFALVLSGAFSGRLGMMLS